MRHTKAPEGFKRWEIKVTLDVSDNWVADGFDMNTPHRIEELEHGVKYLWPVMPFQLNTKVEITATPTKKEIDELQGN